MWGLFKVPDLVCHKCVNRALTPRRGDNVGIVQDSRVWCATVTRASIGL